MMELSNDKENRNKNLPILPEEMLFPDKQSK